MKSMMLAKGTIEATSDGKGEPLVLLHSLLADRSSFDRVIPALAEHFEVITISLPGFGGSPAVEGGLSAIADRVAEAVTELSVPVKLLGNGYGGFIALCLAIRHPNLVARLVLADAGAAFSELGRAAFRGMAMGATAKGLEGIADVAMRRLFAPEFQAANPDLLAERRAAFLATDVNVVIAACEALATLDLRPDLAHLDSPVLAVVGSMDEATPPAMSLELAGLLPNARLEILEGLAHVPQLQAPERFVEAVLPFLGAT